jgi:hypothetical protein
LTWASRIKGASLAGACYAICAELPKPMTALEVKTYIDEIARFTRCIADISSWRHRFAKTISNPH